MEAKDLIEQLRNLMSLYEERLAYRDRRIAELEAEIDRIVDAEED